MKTLTLNQKYNDLNPVTTCSLVKSNKDVVKNHITTGMSPKEISAVVSDHLINIVKQQFQKKEKK